MSKTPLKLKMPSLEIDPSWALFYKNVRFIPCFRAKSRKIITVIAYHNYGYYMAGALGLEPRAYGFGDRRSTN